MKLCPIVIVGDVVMAGLVPAARGSTDANIIDQTSSITLPP